MVDLTSKAGGCGLIGYSLPKRLMVTTWQTHNCAFVAQLCLPLSSRLRMVDVGLAVGGNEFCSAREMHYRWCRVVADRANGERCRFTLDMQDREVRIASGPVTRAFPSRRFNVHSVPCE